jgi:hypothetical protein
MQNSLTRLMYASLLALSITACSNGNDNNQIVTPEPPVVVPPDENSVFAVANGCYAISPDGGESFVSTLDHLEDGPDTIFAAESGLTLDETPGPSRFLMRPSDLGKYLLYDHRALYLAAEAGHLQTRGYLESDISEVDGKVVVQDRLQSAGEWRLLAAPDAKFLLQHIQSGNYIGADGAMVAEADAAALTFSEETDCAVFPELTVDATGDVSVTEFDDGSLFGFVEEHSHLFTNMAFGGGGVFHGAPFHPLGVEHALPSCELNHGVDGRNV